MPIVELTPADVESYTQQRLQASDPETQRLLSAALAAARRYCGWHVTPIISEVMMVDGSGQSDLVLPTLQIQSITSITDNDTTVDLSTVDYSNSEPGILHRNDWTTWTCGLGKVVVELEHGFDDSYDFQAAVLELCDRMAAQVGNVSGNSGPATEQKVDDVEQRWVSYGTNAELFSLLNRELLGSYRLLGIA